MEIYPNTNHIQCQIEQDILQITLCDQENKNALSHVMVAELLNIIELIMKDQTLKVVIITGLDDVFCSGADREVLLNIFEGTIKPHDLLLSRAFLDLPIPTIAAMSGHAVGGGFALGLCADFPIIATKSRYGCPFMKMGFTPGMGITRLLENVMMPPLAHELLYTGSMKKGQDFIGCSGFTAILDKESVLPYAKDLALRIAENPTHILRLLKSYLSMQKRKLFEESITIEAMMHEISFAQNDIKDKITNNYAK